MRILRLADYHFIVYILDLRFRAPNFRFQMPDFRRQTTDSIIQVLDARFQIWDVTCQISAFRFSVLRWLSSKPAPSHTPQSNNMRAQAADHGRLIIDPGHEV